ncbi:MAG TPA: DUF2510 domain-containing protein [Solirubrobacterales bacterium]|nr:DUF2510 domain-containing protein [Solirubrobacterales bacterium]
MNVSPQPIQPQQQQPPAWVLEPVTAWLYLVISIALALSPAWFLGLILGIIAAVFTYQDRKAQGYPTLGWTAAVVLFGALGFLFFVYKRPRRPIVYPPEAALSQQDRVARGLPPISPAAASAPSRPPDWHPDPKGEARLRYWDGANWTDHISE